jgi:MFS family permease
VFVTGYAGKNPKGVPPGTLGFATPTILTVTIVAALLFTALCAAAAILSDRYGRRRVMLAGNVFGIAAGLVVFPVLDTRSTAGLLVGFSLLLMVVAIGYGPAAAALPELFQTRYRYTAAGLGYNLAGILGGAIPIILAPRILDAWGSFGIGIYLAGIALLSTCCSLALPETRHVDIAAPDHDRELVGV